MTKINNDNYPTPIRLARAGIELALSIYPSLKGEKINFMEPGAGNDAPFCKAIKSRLDDSVITRGIELRKLSKKDREKIRDHCDFYNHGRDFLSYEVPSKDWRPNLIVTNPPYSLAEKFARQSLKIIDPSGIVVMLVQNGFSGSKERIDFWEEFPALSVHMPRPRPGFVDFESGSTDMREYYFYVWAGPRLASFLERCGRDWTTKGYVDCHEGPWKTRKVTRK